MKPTAQLHELGQSLWLDNITRDDARRRHAGRLHRRALGHRADLEPDDLRQGDRRRRCLRRADRARRCRRRARTRSSSSSWRSTTCARRPTSSPGPRAHRRGRRLRARSRSRRCSPTTPRRRSSRPRGCTPRPSATTSSSRSRAPRPACPRSRSRSSPASRSTSPCSSRREQYLARRRRLPARDRTADRGRARPRRRARSPRSSSAAGTWRSPTRSPAELRNRLGIAIGVRAYRAYRELLDSDRWQRLLNEGARPQRLLWASTGTKDPEASDMLYVEALASPVHRQHDARERPCSPSPTTARSASRCRPTAATPSRCWPSSASAGIDVDALAARLQEEGKQAFDKSWEDLLASIESKRERSVRR